MTTVPQVVLTVSSYHRLSLNTVVVTLTLSIWHLETLRRKIKDAERGRAVTV